MSRVLFTVDLSHQRSYCYVLDGKFGELGGLHFKYGKRLFELDVDGRSHYSCRKEAPK